MSGMTGSNASELQNSQINFDQLQKQNEDGWKSSL